MKSARFLLLAALAAWALPACDSSGRALGTATSIIVLAADSVWAGIGDSVLTALEPRIRTVRNERTFEVTHISPADPKWQELREFRQIVAIGSTDDAWVQPIVASAQAAAERTGMVAARDVWARNQLAIAVVTPPGDGAAALPHLDRVGAVIDSLFRIYVVQRMYTSEADTALRDALRETHGVTILLPNVYSPVERTGNVIQFQNNTTVGGDLARSVLITWRDGVLTPSADAALAWRDSIGGDYNPAQRTLVESAREAPIEQGASNAVEVQGAWEGIDPSWPMGGLFIARMIACPEQSRTYLVDAWLYAPGPRRSKYEYMIQLQTILGTFECA
ncbi:MAG TPA: DUF4837 family protein [Longimicrobiales bacterium]